MRNAEGFLSITATVWSPDSSRAASSEPTRPQPMITTCTRHLPVGTPRAIVSGLDGLFAPGPGRLNGFFAPAVQSRCRDRTPPARPASAAIGPGDLPPLPVRGLPAQAAAPRPGAEDLPARPRTGQQAGRAGRVLLRPDLLHRLRHRGDPARARR